MHSENPPPSWRRMSVTAAVAMALPAISHGLGLGRAIGEPVLGESLLIEVPVTGSMDRPLDSECIAVRRSPESIDAEYFPRDIVVRVDRQAGTTRLVLSTRSAIRQPLVEFRVSIACGYNLSHDYLLMASPRREPVSQPMAASAQKGDAPAAAPPAGGRAQAEASAPSPAQVSSGASLPDGLAGKSIVVDRDMTLEQLARKHFPGPLRQGRFMRWVAEANPHLFAGSKQLRQHQLQNGQQLVIPDGVPPRRPGDYKNGLTPLGEPMTPSHTDVALAAPARKKAPQPSDEPAPAKSVPDGRKDRLVVGSGSGSSRDVKETVALVERLTGMMEQQLATQAANDEKIKQLEATVADLGKTIARMEKDASEREARWQAERQAEKTAREQEAERGWWQLLMAVGIGGILGAAVLQGFRLLSGRKEGAADTLDAFPATPTEDKAATEPDDSSKPLTEFGWDDDAQNNRPGAMRHSAAPEAKPAPLVASEAAPSQPVRSATPTPAPGVALGMPSTFAESDLEARRRRATEPVANIEFEPPTPEPAAQQESMPSDPAEAAIELANIMTAMGLAQSAAQTLVDHIRENPRQSLGQWLKLLEIHRLNGNRTEFEKYANEVRQHFNVQPDEWAANSGKNRASLEDYPHIRSQIIRLWRRPEAAQLLQALLLDNREGTRAGFPQPVAEEILLLLAMTNSRAQ
jgi:hypothetical protein